MKKFLLLVALWALACPAFAQPYTPASTDMMKVTANDGAYRDVGVYSEVKAAATAASFVTLNSAAYKGTGSAPTPTGTGTPSIATGSTDVAGEVTAGASATSVVITFATAKAAAPFCVARSQSQITSFAYTISTTAITITQTATSGNLIDYICFQP